MRVNTLKKIRWEWDKKRGLHDMQPRLAEALRTMEHLMEIHGDVGAADSEPEGVFQELILSALAGKPFPELINGACTTTNQESWPPTKL